MKRISSLAVFFNFFGASVRTFQAMWSWQRWTLAWGNSPLKIRPSPGRPSMMLNTTTAPLRPHLLRSLKNSPQFEADSLSLAWSPSTVWWLSPVTPMATNTGNFSTEPSMANRVPSTKRYSTDSPERSSSPYASTTWVSSLLTVLTSLEEILRPISLSEINARVRVLTPTKNMANRSSRSESLYCLFQGITWVLNSPLRSRGTCTPAFPIPLRVHVGRRRHCGDYAPPQIVNSGPGLESGSAPHSSRWTGTDPRFLGPVPRSLQKGFPVADGFR